MLLNKQGYDQLPKEQKVNAVKYWNFTTNKDAYYICPNPKYPHVKFIVKKHPKDFCIPCCKKTNIDTGKTDVKKVIHDMCLKNHKYINDIKTITLGSRYIMSYGKDVEPGRLSRLPDNSLEPLLYETFSSNETGVDYECVTTDGYYLYGVTQHFNGINDAGILNIILTTIEMSIMEFIVYVKNLINETPNKFNILLNGKIFKYFTDFNDFLSILTDTFTESANNLKEQNITKIPWSEILIDFIFLFCNINIVMFVHNKNTRIKLQVPHYINSKEQFLSPEFKYIIILKKQNKYFPIYLLNTTVFFKTKIITSKIFNNRDHIINTISSMIESHFNDIRNKYISSGITLSHIIEFTKSNKYKIKKVYINNSNMCYYIHLNKGNNNIFIPLELSYYIEILGIEITYDVYSRNKNKMNIKDMMQFMSEFNKYDTQPDTQNQSAIIIKIDAWLVLTEASKQITNKSNVIGFICNNINYYVNSIKLSDALDLVTKKIMPIYYDPDLINTQLTSQQRPIIDARCQGISKSLYKTNLYKLVLLEYQHIFNKQKNIDIRQKLKKLIVGKLNKDYDELINKILNIVDNNDDYLKIKIKLYDYINNHHSKSKLLEDIEESSYNFDKYILNKLKKLSKVDIYKELLNLSYKFIQYGDINNIKKIKYNNIFVSCQINSKDQDHCSHNKLIVDKKTFLKLLDILTADIMNPIKEKWIFSSMLTDNVISFFKFIKRPDENITITIYD